MSEIDLRIRRLLDVYRGRKPVPTDTVPALREAISSVLVRLEAPGLWEVASIAFTEGLSVGCEDLIRPYFDALLAGPRYAETFRTLEAAGDRTVIFLCRRPHPTHIRQALALRARGWSCHLVHLEPYPPAYQAGLEDAHDHVWRLPNSLLAAEAFVRRIHRGVIHVQTRMLDYATTAAVLRAGAHAPIVCEMVDITSLFADRENLLLYGFSADNVDLDLAMEGVVCREADAVITRFAPESWPTLAQTHGALARFVHFLPYPSPGYIHYGAATPLSQDRPIRTVFAGGLAYFNPEAASDLFPEQTVRTAFEALLEQGIHIDVVHDPTRPVATDPIVRAYRNLLDRFPHFRVFDGVGPDALSRKIADYDLGLNVSAPTATVRPELWKYGIGTKAFGYFEAGLPVLVTAEYEYQARLVRDHGLGMVVPFRDLSGARDLIRSADLPRLRANVRAYNERSGMHVEIERLEQLFEELMAKRRCRAGS